MSSLECDISFSRRLPHCDEAWGALWYGPLWKKSLWGHNAKCILKGECLSQDLSQASQIQRLIKNYDHVYLNSKVEFKDKPATFERLGKSIFNALHDSGFELEEVQLKDGPYQAGFSSKEGFFRVLQLERGWDRISFYLYGKLDPKTGLLCPLGPLFKMRKQFSSSIFEAAPPPLTVSECEDLIQDFCKVYKLSYKVVERVKES